MFKHHSALWIEFPFLGESIKEAVDIIVKPFGRLLFKEMDKAITLKSHFSYIFLSFDDGGQVLGMTGESPKILGDDTPKNIKRVQLFFFCSLTECFQST